MDRRGEARAPRGRALYDRRHVARALGTGSARCRDRRHGPDGWREHARGLGLPQESGQAGRTQVLYLTRELAGYRVVSPEAGDKVTRAEPFAAQVNVGNVILARSQPRTLSM
ncbi:putative phage protein [Burkholderia sp. YI23]|nr:putative phage protein [Burkholderia sp. YI23]